MQEGSSKKADGPTGISQKQTYRYQADGPTGISLQTTYMPFKAMLIEKAENRIYNLF